MGRTFVFAEGKDTLKGVAGRGSKIKKKTYICYAQKPLMERLL